MIHNGKIFLRVSVRTKSIISRAIFREPQGEAIDMERLTFLASMVWVFPPKHLISSLVALPTHAEKSFLSSRISGLTCVAKLVEFTFLETAFWLPPPFIAAPSCNFVTDTLDCSSSSELSKGPLDFFASMEIVPDASALFCRMTRQD